MTPDAPPRVYVYPPRTPCPGLHAWNQSHGMTRCGYCGVAVVGGHVHVQREDRAGLDDAHTPPGEPANGDQAPS